MAMQHDLPPKCSGLFFLWPLRKSWPFGKWTVTLLISKHVTFSVTSTFDLCVIKKSFPAVFERSQLLKMV